MEHDGRTIARNNEERILKALHKFAWLRTRDIAAWGWSKVRSKLGSDLQLQPVVVSLSALRMAQRTIVRLKEKREVIQHKAPDGSSIVCLAAAGVRRLQSIGIPAQPIKDAMRMVSSGQYHHRRLANEIAIAAMLQGYRASSEHEICAGSSLVGHDGILDKKPDVLIRDGKTIWWVEVERSRRNQRDYQKLLRWLIALWSRIEGESVALPDGNKLRRVVFICTPSFLSKLENDMLRAGWNNNEFHTRIFISQSLYISEAKLVHIEGKSDLAIPD